VIGSIVCLWHDPAHVLVGIFASPAAEAVWGFSDPKATSPTLSFNHLIGTGEERRRNRDAQRFSSLEVDH
jgi:hypothetical protein